MLYIKVNAYLNYISVYDYSFLSYYHNAFLLSYASASSRSTVLRQMITTVSVTIKRSLYLSH